MKRIPVKQLALECQTCSTSQFTTPPMIISPDTDDEALALEHLSIALEQIGNNTGFDNPMCIALRATLDPQLSLEDSSTLVAGGVIAAIAAAIIAAVAWFMNRFGKKTTESFNSQISRIEDLKKEVDKSAPPASHDGEFMKLKLEMWNQYLSGTFALRHVNRTEEHAFDAAMGPWVVSTNEHVARNHIAYQQAINTAISTPGVDVKVEMWGDPKPVMGPASKVGEIVGVNGSPGESDLTQLGYLTQVISGIDKYKPAHDDRIMQKLLSDGVASSDELQARRKAVANVEVALKNLPKISNSLKELKSKSQKGGGNPAVKDSLQCSLHAIRVLIATMNWHQKVLNAEEGILRMYSNYQKKKEKATA